MRSALILLLILSLAGFSLPQTQPPSEPVAETLAAFKPELREQIEVDGQGSYLVLLKEQADLSAAFQIANWQARGRFVVEQLRSAAAHSQGPIRSILAAKQASGDLHSFRSMYIVNGFLVKSGVETFDLLIRQPGVLMIEADHPLPEPEIVFSQDQPPSAPQNLAWGVAKIGADAIWRDFGVRGEGVVVANIDSGVDYLHPALANSYRGNLGGGYYDHTLSWFDPLQNSVVPTFTNYHGTHTMGTLVGDIGDVAQPEQIGIAPAARWIAATGYTSYAGSVLAAEWLLAPYPPGGIPSQGNPDLRAHIVSNSWNYYSRNDTSFSGAINAWQAAGIIPVFAAGNFGPDRMTSPADNCGVLAAGATTSTDGIAYFSGRGPSLVPGCPDKPELVAPGVAVRSSIPGNGYIEMDGTSMAAPHAAGCAALLLSLDPRLDYASLTSLLERTAFDLGTPGYDVTFGYGRLDCYAATAALTFLNVTPRQAEICANDSLPVTVRVVEPTDPLPVTLAVQNPPSGLEFHFASGTVTPTTAALITTTLTISVSTAASGEYPLTISGISASRAHTSTLNLTVAAGVPQAPLLVSPASGQINAGRRPLLKWSGGPSERYYLEIAADSGFASPVYTRTVSGSSHQILKSLAFDTTYYWRLTPANACGSGPASLVASFTSETPVLCVDQQSTGLSNGASWADAFPDLSSAMQIASPGSEIWVAAGRYQPGPSQVDTFKLADGMRLYGGFSGGETLRSARNPNPQTNQTILDGRQQNLHVLSGLFLGPGTIVDGFTITGGNANLAFPTGDTPGGGIYLFESSPRLSNLWILKNYALSSGGGINILNGAPVMENIVFQENDAYAGGGLRCNCQGALLKNITFLRNTALQSFGGGMHADGEITLVDAVFAGNRAFYAGGAMVTTARLANVIFVGNGAEGDGGGLISIGNSPQLSQVIFAANSSGTRGSGFYFHGYSYMPPATLSNSIFWQNNTTQMFINGNGFININNILLPGGCPTGATCAGAVLTANPQFVRPPSPGSDGVWGSSDDDYGDLRLLPVSPALDAGNNGLVSADCLDLDQDTDVTEPLPFDLAGEPRFSDVPAPDSGIGAPPLVDLGVYEAVSSVTPTPTATVTHSPTPLPTATPQPSPVPLFLPFLRRG